MKETIWKQWQNHLLLYAPDDIVGSMLTGIKMEPKLIIWSKTLYSGGINRRGRGIVIHSLDSQFKV